MNILVTGSSGFIGKNLVASLKRNNHKIYTFSSTDGNIFDYDFIEKYKNTDIDYVYHLAGKTFVPDSWIDPKSFFNINTNGTLNILNFCDARKIPLIYVSAYIYGNKVAMPVSEDVSPKPNNPYAMSKYLSEKLCFFYAKYKNIKINIFRPFNVYGPGQDKRFLIPEIIYQAKKGSSIIVNSLTPKRDYIYIDDLIDGLILGMHHLDGFEIFNLGSGSSISVEEIIAIVKNQMNLDIKYSSRNINRANEINDVIADISKAKEMLSWNPKTSFEQGIKNIYKSF